VDFEGEQRIITADNVYDEIDRARRAQPTTPEDLLVHKDLLGVIGRELIARLSTTGRSDVIRAAEAILDACRGRAIQFYSSDPQVEAALDVSECTGHLRPDVNEPTLAVTYANLVLDKTSLGMTPHLTVTSSAPANCQRDAVLDIDLHDGLPPGGRPVLRWFSAMVGGSRPARWEHSRE
jgi:hypothetical protein